MEKLDNRRKLILAVIVLAAVGFMFIGRMPSSSTTTTASATTPAAAPTPAPTTVPASASETAPGTAPAVAPQTSPAVAPDTAPAPTDALPAEQPQAETKAFAKFVVYQQNVNLNHYVLSGFMPTGKCLAANSFWQDNCHEGQQCIQISFDTACSSQDQGWGGMYWLSPANNWGSQKGGYNLTGAKKLVFWARGEKGGEIINTFKVGGILDAKVPDSDTASLGPVTLTKDWKEYTIDLTGKDLSYIVGGFAWATDASSNSGTVKFYLDNIYYE